MGPNQNLSVDIVDLIRATVKLTRKGREYTGICPFHHEKTPSFYVVPEKGFWHCFGCSSHGDAVGFVMRTQNLEYREAVKVLTGSAPIRPDHAVLAARKAAERRLAYRTAIIASFMDRHPYGAGVEEIAFLDGLEDHRLAEWAGRPTPTAAKPLPIADEVATPSWTRLLAEWEHWQRTGQIDVRPS